MDQSTGIFVDCTIKLSNRTAVYHMCDRLADVVAQVTGKKPVLRYWRVLTTWRLNALSPLCGSLALTAHKLIGRESRYLPLCWSRGAGIGVFVDVITTGSTRLHRNDIVVVHDLGPYLHPELYNKDARRFAEALYRRVQMARPNIVCVSEFTRRQLLEHFPADYASVSVIHPFSQVLCGAPGLARDNVFLMPGVLEARKNHIAAISAFNDSGLVERGYRLLIVGPAGNATEQILAAAAETRGVEYLGFLSTDDLAELFTRAKFTLFPSVYEGFGLPAIESVALGSMPIVSSNTALEETVGPDGFVANPHSVQDLCDAMRAAAALSPAEVSARLSAIQAYQQRYSAAEFDRKWSEIIALGLAAQQKRRAASG